MPRYQHRTVEKRHLERARMHLRMIRLRQPVFDILEEPSKLAMLLSAAEVKINLLYVKKRTDEKVLPRIHSPVPSMICNISPKKVKAGLADSS